MLYPGAAIAVVVRGFNLLELRRIASGWLVRGRDGLRIPGTPPPVAIIGWTR